MSKIQAKKKRTSISPNRTLWSAWSVYVLTKTGTTRQITSKTEDAVAEYMRNHPIEN
jgi:hypothetical protein